MYILALWALYSLMHLPRAIGDMPGGQIETLKGENQRNFLNVNLCLRAAVPGLPHIGRVSF